MKLIDKNALVAEIEKRISRNKKRKEWEDIPEKKHQLIIEGQLLGELKHFLDSLEVKEVDLEKEIDRVWDNTSDNFSEDGWKEFEEIAKHFFELGMQVSNPITATDRGMAEEIIVNLKRVEDDYRINLTREMEWLRNQVKKGE